MNAGRSYVPPVEIGEVMRAAGIGRVSTRITPTTSRRGRLRGLRSSALRDLRRRGRRHGRHLARPGAGLPRDARDQRPDRLLRPAGCRQAGARPDRGRLGRRRLGGQHRRPDRADQGLPRDRDRWWAGQVRAGWSTSLGSTPRSTTRREDVRATLRDLAPGGVDVFFDNVGGEVLEDVLSRLAQGARVWSERRGLSVQRHRAPRAPPITCSSWSPGRR